MENNDVASNPKRGRGGPKGSKNRKTLEKIEQEKINPPAVKKRGRPKGSKNKKKA